MRLSDSAHLDTFCRDRLPPRDQWPEFRFDLPELNYPERLNCAAELLDATAARDGADRPCLMSATETWTYGETVRRTNQLAQVLTEDFGLRPGNRVMLRGPNTPWLAAAWLAVIKAGGVAVTTMALLRPREIATIVGLTEPSLVLCDHRFAADLAAGAPGLTAVSYGGDGPGDLAARCAAKDGTFTPVDTAADDVAMLASTSGTTGQPKVAIHFHRDVLATADTFSKYLIKPHRQDVFTGTPPLGFTYGLGGLLLFPLRAGASTLLIERATPAELADAIAAHGVTVLSTAPTAYRAMLAAGKAPALKNLRRCVSAGEHLPRSVWEDFRQATGLAIIDGIGSTEMLHIYVSNRAGEVKYGTTGKPVPGYDVRLVDDDGRVVEKRGEMGELQVRGPTSAMMYWNNREQSRATFLGEWTRSGDKYLEDDDGYYVYCGRRDDMLKVGGIYVSPFEVEATLVQHPAVLEAAVIGVPDAEGLTKTKAFVVLKEGAEASEAELKAFVKDRLAPYKYPRAIEFVADLPKTATGKIQRFKLREREREAAGSAPAPWTASTPSSTWPGRTWPAGAGPPLTRKRSGQAGSGAPRRWPARWQRRAHRLPFCCRVQPSAGTGTPAGGR